MSDSLDVRPPPPGAAPNYAARRMLVTAVAITAVVAFAVVGWRAVRGDDTESVGSAERWDRAALIDRTSGAITVIDDGGETVDTITGLGRTTDVYEHAGKLALVGVDQIVLHTGDDEPVLVPIERRSTVTPLRTVDTLHLAVGSATGGNVLIVDASNGDVYDIGALAGQSNPLLFAETLRWSADGSMFAVADAANFQTIVVGAGIDGAVFLPDQPVAVGDELIATSQTVGRQAEVALLDLDRTRKASLPTEIPAGGAMIDDAVMLFSVEGDIDRIESGAEEIESMGSVNVPAGSAIRSIHPTADGTRLFVRGDVFAAVVDLEGETLFSTTFTTPIDLDLPRPEWQCLAVGGDDTYHSLIALDDGRQLADLTGVTVTGVAADGCTVLVERTGINEVITAEGTVLLGAPRDATLGSDGRSVIWTTNTGRTELLTIDEELALAEPIQLPDAPSNLAVAFLTD